MKFEFLCSEDKKLLISAKYMGNWIGYFSDIDKNSPTLLQDMIGICNLVVEKILVDFGLNDHDSLAKDFIIENIKHAFSPLTNNGQDLGDDGEDD